MTGQTKQKNNGLALIRTQLERMENADPAVAQHWIQRQRGCLKYEHVMYRILSVQPESFPSSPQQLLPENAGGDK